MKTAVLVILGALSFALGAIVFTLAQRPDESPMPSASPPPGVSVIDWVPISGTAGVVLSRDSTRNSRNRITDFLDPTVRTRQGVLMVQRDGQWIRFDMLGEFSPQFFPVR